MRVRVWDEQKVVEAELGELLEGGKLTRRAAKLIGAVLNLREGRGTFQDTLRALVLLQLNAEDLARVEQILGSSLSSKVQDAIVILSMEPTIFAEALKVSSVTKLEDGIVQINIFGRHLRESVLLSIVRTTNDHTEQLALYNLWKRQYLKKYNGNPMLVVETLNSIPINHSGVEFFPYMYQRMEDLGVDIFNIYENFEMDRWRRILSLYSTVQKDIHINDVTKHTPYSYVLDRAVNIEAIGRNGVLSRIIQSAQKNNTLPPDVRLFSNETKLLMKGLAERNAYISYEELAVYNELEPDKTISPEEILTLYDRLADNPLQAMVEGDLLNPYQLSMQQEFIPEEGKILISKYNMSSAFAYAFAQQIYGAVKENTSYKDEFILQASSIGLFQGHVIVPKVFDKTIIATLFESHAYFMNSLFISSMAGKDWKAEMTAKLIELGVPVDMTSTYEHIIAIIFNSLKSEVKFTLTNYLYHGEPVVQEAGVDGLYQILNTDGHLSYLKGWDLILSPAKPDGSYVLANGLQELQKLGAYDGNMIFGVEKDGDVSIYVMDKQGDILKRNNYYELNLDFVVFDPLFADVGIYMPSQRKPSLETGIIYKELRGNPETRDGEITIVDLNDLEHIITLKNRIMVSERTVETKKNNKFNKSLITLPHGLD